MKRCSALFRLLRTAAQVFVEEGGVCRTSCRLSPHQHWCTEQPVKRAVQWNPQPRALCTAAIQTSGKAKDSNAWEVSTQPATKRKKRTSKAKAATKSDTTSPPQTTALPSTGLTSTTTTTPITSPLSDTTLATSTVPSATSTASSSTNSGTLPSTSDNTASAFDGTAELDSLSSQPDSIDGTVELASLNSQPDSIDGTVELASLSSTLGGSNSSLNDDVIDGTADSTTLSTSLDGSEEDAVREGAAEQSKAVTMGLKRPALPEKIPKFSQLLDRQKKPIIAPKFALTQPQAQGIHLAYRDFAEAADTRTRALNAYINKQLFETTVPQFRRILNRAMNPDVRDALLAYEPGPESRKILFDLYTGYMSIFHGVEVKLYRELVLTADMRKPYMLYPFARAITRTIHYHLGPTNSGKTYNALKALRQAGSGVYCGPLRLLAMEVYDTLNMDGTYCNLVTGQDKKLIPGADHTACTVEMLNLNRRVDVAVIDEIQMIGDQERGWAWTRALQGVPANEIHLCGDGSALQLVKGIAQAMKEKLHVHKYNRFTPLVVDEKGLPKGYLDVRPGDCIVAFARRDIYSIKELIESETGYRVCVIYGALPPETRRQQARLFNEEGNGYDILVASDAVGMGLNLNIRRIIFHTLHKYNGGAQVVISPSAMKQIGGRAGRRSSTYSMGYVTCVEQQMMEELKQGLSVPMEALKTPHAGLFPEFEQLEIFASQLGDGSEFEVLLSKFMDAARLDGTYFMCKQFSTIQLARLMDKVPGLSLEARYHFCTAPVNLRDYRLMAALMHYARLFSEGQVVAMDVYVPDEPPKTPEELRRVESEHQLVSLWLWLSYRFGEPHFTGREHAESKAQKLVELMAAGLDYMTGEALRARKMFAKGQDDVSETVEKLLDEVSEGVSYSEAAVPQFSRVIPGSTSPPRARHKLASESLRQGPRPGRRT